jgi:predicted dienelactone hydrolase
MPVATRFCFDTRIAAAVFLLLLLGMTRAVFAAGYQPVKVPASTGDSEINAIVWSPCARAPAAVTLGPYVIHGTKNCAIAGSSLPLVVISHGQGGSYLGHHDTALALANAGFVVVSLNHPGDSVDDDAEAQQLRIFESRPRDVSRVISFMLSNWPHRQQLDPAAIGVFGFSRGGYAALALAGAAPSASASAVRFCQPWWSFVLSLCRQLDADNVQIRPQADPRVRAAVVVDPLNLFDAAGVRKVRVPVQLWASEMGGDGVALDHVDAIRVALPQPPEYRIARGAGHFAYLAPCSLEFKKSEPKLCKDPDGFNRELWHQTMNAAVVSFFKRQLQPMPR